jgi:PhnB protein
MVQRIPSGYSGVTAYLIVRGATRALDFYKKAFGAVELMRFPGPNGTIGHAEIKIGEGVVMLADEMPDTPYRGPEAFGGTPVGLMFYVADVDRRFAQAVSAGATVQREVKDQSYGDRSGTLVDPFGHVWTIATHIHRREPRPYTAWCSSRRTAMRRSA